MYEEVVKALQTAANPGRTVALARFFKTGAGQYSEGDVFVGLTVPQVRVVVNTFYKDISLVEVEHLLHSPEHEYRLAALLILVKKYQKADITLQKQIFNLYIKNMRWINNWDLVDSSAEFIVGPQLANQPSDFLQQYITSSVIWDRRIAMLACFYYIKRGEVGPAFDVIEQLCNDPHDLIQKAVGWMLREIGKRCDEQLLTDWLLLDGRYKTLPRTTLRYAIERFDPATRTAYLKGTIHR